METNSLQNENATLVKYLKKFFEIDIKKILFLLVCKCISIKISILILFFNIVIAPRVASYLQKIGFSVLPMDAVNYTTDILNQILARRRQHLERRNDFIQIMVDCEEEEKETEHKEQQWGTLKKSNQ